LANVAPGFQFSVLLDIVRNNTDDPGLSNWQEEREELGTVCAPLAKLRCHAQSE